MALGVFVAPAGLRPALDAMNGGLPGSLNVGGLGFDPEGTNSLNAGTLYAATLGGGTFGSISPMGLPRLF